MASISYRWSTLSVLLFCCARVWAGFETCVRGALDGLYYVGVLLEPAVRRPWADLSIQMQRELAHQPYLFKKDVRLIQLDRLTPRKMLRKFSPSRGAIFAV